MYSIDLRESAVTAYEAGDLTERELANLYGVGEATLRRWRRRKRETGSVAPAARGGGPSLRVRPEDEPMVRAIVDEESDRNIEEIAVIFVQRTSRGCSYATMGRALRRLGLTRKKSP
jgi:transposase